MKPPNPTYCSDQKVVPDKNLKNCFLQWNFKRFVDQQNAYFMRHEIRKFDTNSKKAKVLGPSFVELIYRFTDLQYDFCLSFLYFATKRMIDLYRYPSFHDCLQLLLCFSYTYICIGSRHCVIRTNCRASAKNVPLNS